MGSNMQQTWLTNGEIDEIVSVLDSVRADHVDIGEQRLIAEAPRYARALPSRLLTFLEEYRLAKQTPFCVLSGFPVDDDVVGPTPTVRDSGREPSPAFRQEVFLLLCAHLLGEVSPLRDVLPLQEHDVGPQEALGWHSEDAASADKADYVGLMCLRNTYDVATMICDADWIDWSEVDVAPLFEPRYPVRPSGPLPGEPTADASVKRPLLFGDPGRPHLSLDPDNTVRDGMAPATRSAFDTFTRTVDDALNGFVLWPGDIVFIDNRRAVHGQEPVPARGDGTDQWLKQLKVTRRPDHG
jgi:L-asparagine oxygenase